MALCGGQVQNTNEEGSFHRNGFISTARREPTNQLLSPCNFSLMSSTGMKVQKKNIGKAIRCKWLAYHLDNDET